MRFGGGGGSRRHDLTAPNVRDDTSTLRLVQSDSAKSAESDPVDDALRAVSLALRTDAARTRRELLRLLAELD
jgi:hypothetical protein